MGESKRRKMLDPSYGKVSKAKLDLQIPPVYLIPSLWTDQSVRLASLEYVKESIAYRKFERENFRECLIKRLEDDGYEIEYITS